MILHQLLGGAWLSQGLREVSVTQEGLAIGTHTNQHSPGFIFYQARNMLEPPPQTYLTQLFSIKTSTTFISGYLLQGQMAQQEL